MSEESPFPPALLWQAERLVQACTAAGIRVATAESCTGGLVAGLLTEVPGSSAVLERGWVTYSNEAKGESLGVPPDLIAAHGAVSEEVARAMAEGGLARSRAHAALAVTGIAGPGGATVTKPVGLVWFAVARLGGATRAEVRRYGELGRHAVRLAAVGDALALLTEAAAGLGRQERG